MYRLAFAALLCLSCSGPSTRRVIDQPPDPFCGDGTANENEECDGSDLKSATCQSLGYVTGTVSCTSGCTISKVLCSKPCGNGVIDPGEVCDGKVGVPSCDTFGFVACSDTCQLDRTHCVSPGLQAGPVLELAKGGPAVIGDVPPKGPGDLVMAVPAFARVEIFPWTMAQGFTETGSRKLSYQRSPRRAFVAELTGDSNADLAQLNDDGSLDVLAFTGSGFSLRTTDAGCPGGEFLARFGNDAGPDTLVLSCSNGAATFYSGAPRRVPVGPGALACGDLNGDGAFDLATVTATDLSAALAPTFAQDGGAPVPATATEIVIADFDGDRDGDVAAITTSGLALWENTGSGWAAQTTIPLVGLSFLRAVDLDGDGAADLVGIQNGAVIVRRNQTNWVFAPHDVLTGLTQVLSLAIGDVDGDGDLDLAVTTSLGGDQTRTSTATNRVR